MDGLTKIIITGPESTGKSWLTQKLGHFFKVPYALEYARTYLEKHGPQYTYETVADIAREHLRYQEGISRKAGEMVFLDTDLLNFKIWEEVVFKKTHPFIEKGIKAEKDHIYLLTYPDIPWAPDPLRENPENRLELFDRQKKLLDKLGRPYEIVKGTGEHRLKNAKSALQKLLVK